VTEIFPEIFYAEGDESIFCPPVIQVQDDAAQVEDDVFDTLHTTNFIRTLYFY
jgi:hypothetical protein